MLKLQHFLLTREWFPVQSEFPMLDFRSYGHRGVALITIIEFAAARLPVVESLICRWTVVV